MTDKLSIIAYRDYYDVPRIFFIRCENKLLLLDCSFDDELEEHPSFFEVLEMPQFTDEEIMSFGSWYGLADKATKRLGQVSVKDVQFHLRNKAIDSTLIETLLDEQSPKL